jgi:transposase
MRGIEDNQESMFSYVSTETRIPSDHPLRAVRTMADKVLLEMNDTFERQYSQIGRPSIPPEYLIRATLLQIFHSIRSERLLMEQLNYNLLFRWFVGMSVDQEVWNHSTFSKNRERLLTGMAANEFFVKVVDEAKNAGLLSDEHFSVDGTLIESWASLKSFRPKDGSGKPPDGPGRNATVDFHGEQRTNDSHASTTDPEARLTKKSAGHTAKICHMAHVKMENRNGLAVDCEVNTPSGFAERDAALAMMGRGNDGKKKTIGADKGYDHADFVTSAREMGYTPHVSQNTSRGRVSPIDERTTRHSGYAVSIRIRKRIEEIFGWLKTIGGMHKMRVVGQINTEGYLLFALAGFNMIRMRSILGAANA